MKRTSLEAGQTQDLSGNLKLALIVKSFGWVLAVSQCRLARLLSQHANFAKPVSCLVLLIDVANVFANKRKRVYSRACKRFSPLSRISRNWHRSVRIPEDVEGIRRNFFKFLGSPFRFKWPHSCRHLPSLSSKCSASSKLPTILEGRLSLKKSVKVQCL